MSLSDKEGIGEYLPNWPVFKTEDVKKFIRDIKECPMGIPWEVWIDEKAGKELI